MRLVEVRLEGGAGRSCRSSGSISCRGRSDPGSERADRLSARSPRVLVAGCGSGRLRVRRGRRLRLGRVGQAMPLTSSLGGRSRTWPRTPRPRRSPRPRAPRPVVTSRSLWVVRTSVARSCARSMMRADLLVDRPRDFVRVVALLADLAAQEDELFALAEGRGPSFSLMPNSVTMRRASVGGLLDVVRGAGRHLAEDEPLGDVAAEHARRSCPRTGTCVWR